jgi:hypothetical protein
VLWNQTLPVASPAALLPSGRLFAQRGLYVYRSGWKQAVSGDEMLFTLYSGEFRGGHAQEDQGSFTLYAYGDRYALDAGYPSPTMTPKETEAHNLILIDGRGQHNAGGSIGTDGRIASALVSGFADYVRADVRTAYTTYSPFNAPGVPFPDIDWSWGYDGGNPVQRADRVAVVVKGGAGPYVLVGDDIQKDAAPHDYEWLLHTDLANDVVVSSNPVRITGSASTLDVYFAAPQPPALQLTAAPFAHGGEDPESMRISARANTVAPEFFIALLPRQNGEPLPNLASQRVQSATFVMVDRKGQVDLALFAPTGPPPPGSFALDSDARVALVRLERNAVEGYLVGEGATLSMGGQSLVQLGAATNVAWAGDSLHFGSNNTPFRAYGPGVSHVFGPYGPIPFSRDGDYVVSAFSAGLELPVSTTLRLEPCRPNPFRSQVSIAFEVPEPRAVELGIYDTRGRLVRRLLAGEIGPGRRQVIWDGRDSRGASLPAGLYLVRLRCGIETSVRKVLLAR